MFALAGPIVADFAALNHAIHIAASLLPAGFSVFTLLLAQPAAAKLGGPAALRGLRSRLIVPMRWSLLVAFASGLIWLATEALSMSGLAVRDAMTREVLGTVLGSTLFGRLWVLRAVLLAALAAWLLRPRLHRGGAGGGGARLGARAVGEVGVVPGDAGPGGGERLSPHAGARGGLDLGGSRLGGDRARRTRPWARRHRGRRLSRRNTAGRARNAA